MKISRFYFRFFVLVFLFTSPQLTEVVAQDQAVADSATSNIEKPFIAPIILPDSSNVDLRIPDISIIENYYSNPDFQYEGTPPNPDSFIGILLFWIFRGLSYFLGTPAGNFILKAVVYFAIGGVVLLLLNQFLEGNLSNILRRKNPEKSLSPNVTEEDLDKINFKKLHQEALEKSDFASATRYAFLITLQLLYNKGLIQFSIEKTNNDYERELIDHPSFSYFSKLVMYYEFVEYGDFEIDAEKYQSVEQALQDIKRAVA